MKFNTFVPSTLEPLFWDTNSVYLKLSVLMNKGFIVQQTERIECSIGTSLPDFFLASGWIVESDLIINDVTAGDSRENPPDSMRAIRFNMYWWQWEPRALWN